MPIIKFGTDGWRAKMGDDFSFKNVRIFAQAYSAYLKGKTRSARPCVLVNYDTRFLSQEFAREAAKIFSLNGIHTWMPDRDTPLAPIALAVTRHKCSGGITFTASFDKPIYNGLKVFNHKGVPALPEETTLIENHIEEAQENFCFKPQYPDKDLIDVIDVKTSYVDYIRQWIDFDRIRKAGLRIIVDNLYGTSREYLEHILAENGIESISIHSFPYSDFGGIVSVCNQESLNDLSQLVMQQKADLGLATDIDGSRFGIVDTSGKFINSSFIIPPLIEYLVNVRKMEGGIAKSITTTHNIRQVGEYYGRKIFTTPVGSKYLAHSMLKDDVFMGVEGSNGASLNGEIKVKDGILFNLLVTEMIAYHGGQLEKILEEFYRRFPRLYSREIMVRRTERTAEGYRRLLENQSINTHPFKLKECKFIDGIKMIFENAWLVIRESGTDNLIRLYAESPGVEQTRQLIRMGRSLIE